MLIIFRNQDGELNCATAAQIGYDRADNGLWFYTEGVIYTCTALTEDHAEEKIRKAYEDGKVDISGYVCEIDETED